MIRGLVSTVLWLLACAAAGGSLFWALVNTPDSNALMLVVSLLLVIGLVAVGAAAASGAVLLTRNNGWWRGLIGGTVRGLPWFLAALVPVLVLVWLSRAAEAWMTAHSGEISAWFIAQFGWADVSWLFTTVHVLLAWVAWVAAPWLGLTLFSAGVTPARQTSIAASWIARARRWKSLALATLWFCLLLALPWHLALWRPTGVPPTWIEPSLAALRLGIVLVLMAIGVALIVRAAAIDRAPEATAPVEES